MIENIRKISTLTCVMAVVGQGFRIPQSNAQDNDLVDYQKFIDHVILFAENNWQSENILNLWLSNFKSFLNQHPKLIYKIVKTFNYNDLRRLVNYMRTQKRSGPFLNQFGDLLEKIEDFNMPSTVISLIYIGLRYSSDKKLSKVCKMIAGDEMRHHHAYSEFVNQIFKVDPSEMMLAFQYMMKAKIVMPAHFLRESGEKISTAFEQFSDSAQRIGVYTAADYVDIMQKLIDKWEIDKIAGLTDEAEKARDYLMRLPARMAKISERLIIPEESYIFKWVEPAKI